MYSSVTGATSGLSIAGRIFSSKRSRQCSNSPHARLVPAATPEVTNSSQPISDAGRRARSETTPKSKMRAETSTAWVRSPTATDSTPSDTVTGGFWI
jgi:hypothetical protein